MNLTRLLRFVVFKKKKKGSIEPLERREERPKWRFLSFVLANHEI